MHPGRASGAGHRARPLALRKGSGVGGACARRASPPPAPGPGVEAGFVEAGFAEAGLARARTGWAVPRAPAVAAGLSGEAGGGVDQGGQRRLGGSPDIWCKNPSVSGKGFPM